MCFLNLYQTKSPESITLRPMLFRFPTKTCLPRTTVYQHNCSCGQGVSVRSGQAQAVTASVSETTLYTTSLPKLPTPRPLRSAALRKPELLPVWSAFSPAFRELHDPLCFLSFIYLFVLWLLGSWRLALVLFPWISAPTFGSKPGLNPYFPIWVWTQWSIFRKWLPCICTAEVWNFYEIAVLTINQSMCQNAVNLCVNIAWLYSHTWQHMIWFFFFLYEKWLVFVFFLSG